MASAMLLKRKVLGLMAWPFYWLLLRESTHVRCVASATAQRCLRMFRDTAAVNLSLGRLFGFGLRFNPTSRCFRTILGLCF